MACENVSVTSPMSVYEVPYQHQTYNHLIFDRIRSVQLEVELLKAYLEQDEFSRIGGAGLKDEIDVLAFVSHLLFDDVYHTLRKKWR